MHGKCWSPAWFFVVVVVAYVYQWSPAQHLPVARPAVPVTLATVALWRSPVESTQDPARVRSSVVQSFLNFTLPNNWFLMGLNFVYLVLTVSQWLPAQRLPVARPAVLATLALLEH